MTAQSGAVQTALIATKMSQEFANIFWGACFLMLIILLLHKQNKMSISQQINFILLRKLMCSIIFLNWIKKEACFSRKAISFLSGTREKMAVVSAGRETLYWCIYGSYAFLMRVSHL